ncbi:T9SS type A sorting domain-containing protein [Aurantibacillus circumpalustris]|uniref:T9SS type A sorting domain-containing protein n=1 Tax=Aurantibacillus circumpalustris TaxID=3036359 RepID=UPI00295BEF7B|nr:T9SS type A sorting domain-containing protein [Aurantibacillus circumpalustris]
MDTTGTKFFGKLFAKNLPPFIVPLSSQTYQWPRHGNNFLASTFYCPSCASNVRGYPRNNLKQVLTAGKTYCFTMYLNLTNKSSYSIDRMGVYFSDATNDTIKYCATPITYLTPQIQSPDSMFLSDTLNWMLFQGLYTAIGNEKYIIIGNFRNNANTHNVFVNSTTLPQIFTDYCIDDVSCIDIDLPAFAGNDAAVIPGDSVYLGRESDVGIDEACMWYQLPTVITPTTPAIDTIAGFWIKPVTSCTYVVRQDICGHVKWDTVIIAMNPVGNVDPIAIGLEMLNDKLMVFPNPANDYLELKISNADLTKDSKVISIYNNLGQLIREEEISFTENKLLFKTSELENGVYFLRIKSVNAGVLSKRFVAAR